MNLELRHYDTVPAYGTNGPDLWCTYAALRTLRWLGSGCGIDFTRRTENYLYSRRNADGGYGWSRGMQSDAWATFYATQGIRDLGGEIPHIQRTSDWLRTTWTSDAYGMLPGQRPDVWATHFSTRTSVEICNELPPDITALCKWLGALQTTEGGLSWSPEHAQSGQADARACFYGVMAWKAIKSKVDVPSPWDVPRLVRWLQGLQRPEGGYTFNERALVPCMWATYRATATLTALEAAPMAPSACTTWVIHQRGPRGAFVRWPGYLVEDVWASFCAVGTLKALDKHRSLYEAKPAVESALFAMRCPTGGFTYRENMQAADVLSTAAHVLCHANDAASVAPLIAWLESCQLPNEAGVMYMPGRGAEVRCTLWALAAGAFQQSDSPEIPQLRHLVEWLRALQNPDGGFGYWEGRGSDMVSTASAVEAMALAGHRTEASPVMTFVEACKQHDDDGEATYANVPGGRPSLRASLQAYRIRHHATGHAEREAVSRLLKKHHARSGGYDNSGSRVPDLLTTYEAVVTADRFGLELELSPLWTFTERILFPDGTTSWTPLAPPSNDALAHCLGRLLQQRLLGDGRPMPALSL